MIDYTNFKIALTRLNCQLINYQTMDNTLPQLTKEAIKESVIQRFEVCYDCMWKVLKKYIAIELGVPDIPNSPKPILRIAGENNLIADVNNFMLYAEARVSTSHDYNEQKATKVLEIIPDFVNDAILLYERISGEIWSQKA